MRPRASPSSIIPFFTPFLRFCRPHALYNFLKSLFSSAQVSSVPFDATGKSNKIFFHILNKHEILAHSLNKHVWPVGRINLQKKKTKLTDKLHSLDFTAAVKCGLSRGNWQAELNVDGGFNTSSMYTIRRGLASEIRSNHYLGRARLISPTALCRPF